MCIELHTCNHFLLSLGHVEVVCKGFYFFLNTKYLIIYQYQGIVDLHDQTTNRLSHLSRQGGTNLANVYKFITEFWGFFKFCCNLHE